VICRVAASFTGRRTTVLQRTSLSDLLSNQSPVSPYDRTVLHRDNPAESEPMGGEVCDWCWVILSNRPWILGKELVVRHGTFLLFTSHFHITENRERRTSPCFSTVKKWRLVLPPCLLDRDRIRPGVWARGVAIMIHPMGILKCALGDVRSKKKKRKLNLFIGITKGVSKLCNLPIPSNLTYHFSKLAVLLCAFLRTSLVTTIPLRFPKLSLDFLLFPLEPI